MTFTKRQGTGYLKKEAQDRTVDTSLWKGLGTGRKTDSRFNKFGHTCISRAVTAQSPQKLSTGYVTTSIPGTGNNFLFAIKKSHVGAGVDPTTLAAKTCGLRALNESNVDTAEVTVILFQTYIWSSDPTRQHHQIRMNSTRKV